jgi:hypothetical protein
MVASRGTAGDEQGTSVTILVDFSASFAPLRGQDGQALRDVVRAIGDLSTDWPRPIKITWSKIETASLLASPLCAPIEFSPNLIKRKGEISTREELQKELEKCREVVIRRSQRERSMNTDISGAVLAAAESTRKNKGEKVLILLSDLDQDLPKGATAADFKIYGERVVILHRPWSRDANNPNGYFERIRRWSEEFKNRGAKETTEFPVFAVTEQRLARAFGQTSSPPGTSVAILADLKADGPGGQHAASEFEERLSKIAGALTDLAKDWQLPITITWSNIGYSGTACEYMLPLVVKGTLLKKTGEMNISEDLRIPMQESARGLAEKYYGTVQSTDISGAVALATAGNDLGEKRILVIVSDFVDNNRSGGATKFQLPGATVLMVWRFAPSDAVDPSAWSKRMGAWEQSFKDSGATVCRIAMQSLVSSDIKECLSSGQAGDTTR